jgi:hypothetical protein
MSDTRISVVGENEFDEREWLRREVLWGSLMAPYPSQMQGWFNGLETFYHFGNSSRQNIYAGFDESPEIQAKAFFNQGKVISTIISCATVLRASIKYKDLKQLYNCNDSPKYNTLKLQARNVDIVLGNISVRSIALQGGDRASFLESERMAMLARDSENSLARSHRLLRAAKIMTGLGINEMAKWREMSAQNYDKTLPELIIPNGGTPRSSGPRVEKLKPVFKATAESEIFKSF